MSSFRSRAALSVCMLVGILAGCATSPARNQPADKSDVTAKDFERNPNEPIETVLQRMVPGVVITKTSGGGIALQIRGAFSVNGGDTAPLYVLNDLPFEPGAGGELTGINPYDIESIKVLKGTEAGEYGMRGANGVILIKTKKGPARH